jgi:amino acid adenylation domain-containing protein
VRSGPLFLDLGQQVVAQTRNMLPIRVEVDPQRSFVKHIRTQAASLAEAEQNRLFSLAEMIQLAKPARDQSRSPLFTAAFSQQHRPAPPALGALQTAWAHTPAPGARYDLELALLTAPDGAWLVCDYSTELFAPETIGRWLDGLVAMLRAGLEAAEPETACGVLPMMSAVEHQKLLLDWNRTQQPYPKDQTVLDLVAARARDHPNAPAVRCDETVLTFQQLLQRVQVLAALLVGHGVVAGDRVAILLNRSPDLIAALLAAWRVGATYVPLDPGFPRKRLAYMLEDAGVRAIVTSRSLASSLPEGFADRAACVDGPGPAPAEPVQVRPARATDSAYIIYTSGSTGLPKGVQVGHRGLVNCLLAVHRMIGLQAGDALLAITTVSFDIATVELLMPLIAGGVVDIAPDGVVADGLRLAELIAAHQPAYLQATPSIWKMVLAAGWQGEARLGMVSGGETLSRELAEQLLSRGRALWNFYGPTETTVWSLGAKVASAPDQPVDIGRPLANTQVYVLDDQLQPAAPGAVGELYIGGDGLAQSYWRRPELTAGRFVRHPFGADERLYRTGDLARHRPDGSLLCLGRLDDQAKIHGVRVEPGEVEAALRKVAGVADAVVTSRRTSCSAKPSR